MWNHHWSCQNQRRKCQRFMKGKWTIAAHSMFVQFPLSLKTFSELYRQAIIETWIYCPLNAIQKDFSYFQLHVNIPPWSSNHFFVGSTFVKIETTTISSSQKWTLWAKNPQNNWKNDNDTKCVNCRRINAYKSR